VEDGIVRNTQIPAHDIDDRLGRSHDGEGGRGLGTETDGRSRTTACRCGLLVREFRHAKGGGQRGTAERKGRQEEGGIGSRRGKGDFPFKYGRHDGR